MSKDILFERRGDVGNLTLNRPHTLNTTTRRMMGSCRDLIADLSGTSAARALVVTGAGSAFCSGVDLGKGRSAGARPLEDSGRALTDDIRDTLNPFVLSLYQAPFSVVAALNGAAAGAGAGLALSCDFIVAARSARLLLTSRIGMGLDAGTSWFLTQALGQKRALALSMLGESIAADDMLSLGLAWRWPIG